LDNAYPNDALFSVFTLSKGGEKRREKRRRGRRRGEEKDRKLGTYSK
jgi:hypothetical protein